jgi:hypothetical protein
MNPYKVNGGIRLDTRSIVVNLIYVYLTTTKLHSQQHELHSTTIPPTTSILSTVLKLRLNEKSDYGSPVVFVLYMRLIRKPGSTRCKGCRTWVNSYIIRDDHINIYPPTLRASLCRRKLGVFL